MFSIRRHAPLILPAFLVALSTAGEARAQFAVQGGLSLSDLVGSGVRESETRQGLTGAGGWNVLSIGPVGLGLEASYIQKGTSELVLDPVTGAPVSFGEFGVDYVEVPVIARLGFGLPLDGLRAHVAGGPALAWRLNCSIRPVGEGSLALNDDCIVSDFQGVDHAIRSADRGMVLGGGLTYQLAGMGAVTLNARMIRGLVRLAEDPDDPEARNQVFTLTLGWDLGF